VYSAVHDQTALVVWVESAAARLPKVNKNHNEQDETVLFVDLPINLLLYILSCLCMEIQR
jgi:hypothetical protein